MWVKICGNTNLEDAMQAAELGADAVGFVFAPSKRQVTAAQVAAIAPHLPAGVERVGVFDSRDADEVAGVAIQASLTAVQLHGGLDEGLVERLAKRLAGRVRIIQTLHWTVESAGSAVGSRAESSAAMLALEIEQVKAAGVADRILVDSKVGTAGGGTGVAYDWDAARLGFQGAQDGMRLIVAGGLNPGNVAEAIARLRPWGVDVCSGVEHSPGRKNPALVAQFIATAHGAETLKF